MDAPAGVSVISEAKAERLAAQAKVRAAKAA